MVELTGRKMACSKCHKTVENVGLKATSVTCSNCVQEELQNINETDITMKGGENYMADKEKSTKKVAKEKPAKVECKEKPVKEKRVTFVSIVEANKTKEPQEIADIASKELKKNISPGRVIATLKYLSEQKE